MPYSCFKGTQCLLFQGHTMFAVSQISCIAKSLFWTLQFKVRVYIYVLHSFHVYFNQISKYILLHSECDDCINDTSIKLLIMTIMLQVSLGNNRINNNNNNRQ